MCGRFTVVSPADVLADVFGLLQLSKLQPRFNIAPTQDVLAIVAGEQGGARVGVNLRWGLVPAWAKDPKIGSKMINARSETLAEKPSFRSAFKRRRCLIPANGFYEWLRSGKQRQPYLFRMDDFSPFAMAGLWEAWGSGAESIRTCTVITTRANCLLEPFHDRMPVILGPERWDTWFDANTPVTELAELFEPYPAEAMMAYAVNPKVNSVANDGPECIAPYGDQPSLF